MQAVRILENGRWKYLSRKAAFLEVVSDLKKDPEKAKKLFVLSKSEVAEAFLDVLSQVKSGMREEYKAIAIVEVAITRDHFIEKEVIEYREFKQ